MGFFLDRLALAGHLNSVLNMTGVRRDKQARVATPTWKVILKGAKWEADTTPWNEAPIPNPSLRHKHSEGGGSVKAQAFER